MGVVGLGFAGRLLKNSVDRASSILSASRAYSSKHGNCRSSARSSRPDHGRWWLAAELLVPYPMANLSGRGSNKKRIRVPPMCWPKPKLSPPHCTSCSVGTWGSFSGVAPCALGGRHLRGTRKPLFQTATLCELVATRAEISCAALALLVGAKEWIDAGSLWTQSQSPR